MEKMMKPEVKAVRFGSADVIATSSSLSNDTTYYTRNSELHELNGNSNDYNGSSYYKFTYYGSITELSNVVEYGGTADTDGDLPYAWYNGSSWYTDGTKYSEAAGKEWKQYSGGTSYTR